MRTAFLSAVASLSCRYPKSLLAAALALTFFCTVYSQLSLRINSNPDELVSEERPHHIAYQRFLREFGDLEYMYVVVADSGNETRTRACVDALKDRLQGIAELPNVFAAITPREQLKIATRAMPEEQLRDLAYASSAFPVFLTGQDPGVALTEATRMLEHLRANGLSLSVDARRELGAGAMMLLKNFATVADPESERELLSLTLDSMSSRYFQSPSGKLFFIRIVPIVDYGTMEVVERPLEAIREAMADVQKKFPEMEIGLTGKQVILADQMVTTSQDMTKASVISIVFCLIVFMLMTGSFWRPIMAVASLLCGIAWTLGMVTFVLGEMNLFSTVFMPLLIGIGDFGVHLVVRYDEERLRHSSKEAVRRAILAVGPGCMTTALTSCTAFYVTMLTDFKGIRELGFVSGTGLLLCLLATLLVLPPLLVVFDRRRCVTPSLVAEPITLEAPAPMINDIRRPVFILAVCAALSIGLLPEVFNVGFDDNLLDLQAQDLDSVRWEYRILDDSNSTTLYGVVIAEDYEQLHAMVEKARTLPSIGVIHSIGDVILPDTPERLELRDRLHSRLAGSRDGRVDKPSGTDAAQGTIAWGSEDLERAAASVERLARLAALQSPAEGERMDRVAASLRELAARMRHPDSEIAKRCREQIESRFEKTGEAIAAMLEGDRMGLAAALPESVRGMFLSKNGRFLIMLHPRKNVWNTQALAEFVGDLRKVDPSATGFPVNHLETISEMKQSASQGFFLAIAAVFFLLWFDFRNLKDTLLAVAPLLAGLLGTFEAMGLLRINFNLVNFISASILVGISVDFGVHIVHRYRESGEESSDLGSTPRAIILTALTNLIGFGSLITAQHLGARSFGMLMGIGGVACLIASMLILPNLLIVLQYFKQKSRESAAVPLPQPTPLATRKAG
ncbi:MAG: MMPL family transporter [Planctomycetota bacterium]